MDKHHFSVPKYLVSVLKMVGFNSVKTFAALGPTDLNLVYNAIEEKIRFILQKSEKSVIRATFVNYLREFLITGNNFKLPIGHEFLLKAIRDHCIKIQDDKFLDEQKIDKSID